MHGIYVIFITLAVTSVQCRKQKDSDRKNIINIDDVKFFKKIMKTHTNLLVLFSQSEKEVSEKLDLLGVLAQQFKGKGTVAFVNCGEHSKVCKKFKVTTKHGPVLKHYKNGKFNKDYDRKNTLKSLTIFMSDPTGDTPWEEEPGAESVRHIDGDKDLGKLLNKEKKPIFVMFYAPWCGFCKRLKPVYQEIASELKSVLLASMDVDRAESMNSRMQFNITGFPTLIYFQGGKELYRYKGKHEKEILMDWLQNPSDESPKSESEEEEWKDTPSDVVHLTDGTFDEYISANPSVLVMFYAPWCGHCKAMKPEYVDAAKTMKDENISGTLAAVDATKESALGKKFEVQGFPTVKYFKNGEFAFDVNERKADKILEFMKDPTEPPPPPPPEPEWKDTPSDVVHLQDASFKEYVKKKKHVLVMFYAPWCGHCKKAKPEFTEAAKQYTDNKKVEFAAVDCTKEVSTCGAYGVEGYPTFRYFNYGKNDMKYSGGREKDDFINYMKNPQEPPKLPPEEQQWSDEPSFVEHLTDNNFEEFILSHDSVLVMFYAPWCGHCKAMKPAYVEAAEEMEYKKVNGVLAAVNCMKETKLRTKYEITGFPSVKYFRNGKYAYDYPRSRTKDDLVDFMKNPSEPSKATDSAVPADLPWSEGKNDVVHLSEKDFDQFVQDHGSVLVMFYAPWCGHCKKAKPEFEEAATTVNREEQAKGKMAAVDCTTNKDLCSRFGVKGYPTIKYFKDGKDSFKYQSARKAKSFVEFINNPQPPEPEWSTVPGKVKHLTDATLVDFLKNHKSVLVMFYSPGCGYCKAMKPDYIAAADQLNMEGSDIVLAAMDAIKNPKTAAEHVKTGYPTIKFFRYGEEITEYDDSRTKDDIITFVKLMDKETDSDNGKTVEGEEEWKFKFVEQLNQEKFETTLQEVEHALVMFYAPWCGHCQNAKPKFDKAAESIKEYANKMLAAVDCTVETDICERENVSGYPTIKYYQFGIYSMDYEKSRTAEEFISFLGNPPNSPFTAKEEL